MHVHVLREKLVCSQDLAPLSVSNRSQDFMKEHKFGGHLTNPWSYVPRQISFTWHGLAFQASDLLWGFYVVDVGVRGGITRHHLVWFTVDKVYGGWNAFLCNNHEDDIYWQEDPILKIICHNALY